METRKKVLHLILIALLLLAHPASAENGMNSPYTRFGFGQLAGMDTGTSKGMGGTGIGIHNSNHICERMMHEGGRGDAR